MAWLCAPAAFADFQLVIERAGFFGKYAGGVVYAPAPAHEIELALGFYPINKVYYGQLDLEYRYCPWTIEYKYLTWHATQVGLFLINAQDARRFYNQDPNGYPQENYYSETAIRYGLTLGTALAMPAWHLQLAYRFRIIDTGLLAVYNNVHRDLQYYISSGLSLAYVF